MIFHYTMGTIHLTCIKTMMEKSIFHRRSSAFEYELQRAIEILLFIRHRTNFHIQKIYRYICIIIYFSLHNQKKNILRKIVVSFFFIVVKLSTM